MPKSRKQNFNYNYHHNLYDYYDVVNADVDVDDDDYVDDAEEYGAARTSPVVLSGCLINIYVAKWKIIIATAIIFKADHNNNNYYYYAAL